MKIHFSWTISPTPQMELQSKLAVRAARNLGPCTIWVHENEYSAVTTELKRMAEVIPYRAIDGMELPWSSTPKWAVEPKGDVVVGLDADVMVWREDLVLRAAEECLAENVLCGTVTYIEILPEADWRALFRRYSLPEDFPFQYTHSRQAAPFHINNGVVMMPATMLPAFRKSFYTHLPDMNRMYPGLYYMCELATTVAIMKAGLPVKAMPKTFNYVEFRVPGLPDLKDVAFLHYNTSRNDPLNATNETLRQRCRQLETIMPISNETEAMERLQEVMDFLRSRTPAPAVVSLPAVDEFEQLKQLLESPAWPEAAPDFLICDDTEEHKVERAKVIMELTTAAVGDLKGRKFLDFGCGDGHTTRAASALGAIATGYDIGQDWEAVKAQGPFDAVLLYDVLDHCENPVATLTQLAEVVTPDTKVFCRCHPWTGPHGGHYYQQKNKAYVHLVFTDDELQKLGLKPVFVQKVKFPIRDEHQWFTAANFNVVSQSMEHAVVGEFFKQNPLVVKRLSLPEYDNKVPEWQMSQTFNDFVISKKP